jgi:flagellar biosynthesis/type III secretory pathway protein FliH
MWTISRVSRVLPAALIAAGLLISAPACSADIYTNARRGPYVDIGRRAYDNGYRQGLEEGRDDAGHHRSFSLDRHGDYRNAERGYRREDGERNPYREGFRRGFENGYRDAYNRYARGR